MKINYCSIFYGSARKNTNNKVLLTVRNNSSPKTMMTGAAEPSLYLRRKQLYLQYISRIISNCKQITILSYIIFKKDFFKCLKRTEVFLNIFF